MTTAAVTWRMWRDRNHDSVSGMLAGENGDDDNQRNQ